MNPTINIAWNKQIHNSEPETQAINQSVVIGELFKFYLTIDFQSYTATNLNIQFLVDVMLWWIWGELQKRYITFNCYTNNRNEQISKAG